MDFLRWLFRVDRLELDIDKELSDCIVIIYLTLLVVGAVMISLPILLFISG